jgi:hypothetical protein
VVALWYLVTCVASLPLRACAVIGGGGAMQHKRVHHVWGSNEWAVAADGTTLTFNSFEQLMKAPALRLKTPCPRAKPNQKAYESPYEEAYK